MKLALILLSFMIQKTFGVQIHCEFRLSSEECKISSLDVPKNDQEVTEVFGSHGYRKTNNDVKELWMVREVGTEYVPTNICKFFENMQRMDIYGRQIKFISKDVFKNCGKVTKVCILFTALTTLPDSLFANLGELRELLLYENNLVILPENLVTLNSKLKTFSARSNRLSIIDITFGSSITSIDLTVNTCIDEKLDVEKSNLTAFNNKVAENCENPAKRSFKNRIALLQSIIDGNDEQIKTFKSQQENMERFTSVLESNVTDLSLSNAKLKEENARRIDEIRALNSGAHKEMTTVFDENIILRSNLTTCRASVNDKAKETRALVVKSAELEGNVKQFREENIALKANSSAKDEVLKSFYLKIEFIRSENWNLNDSLEECWQNVSSLNELVEELDVQITDLEGKVLEEKKTLIEQMAEFKERCRMHSEKFTEDSCGHKVHFGYLVVLALTFAVLFIVTVLFLRRQNERKLIRDIINHEVNMKQLVDSY